jgi:nitrogen fixation protein NifU and related proteins
MDHFKNPRNVGVIENPDGVGRMGNPRCGDLMEMTIRVAGDVITDIKFRTFGCGAAIATSSMATEMLKGKTIDEALEVTNRAIAEALDGLPPIKMHCSVLAADALRAALADYFKKQGNLERAAELLDEKILQPQDAPEAREPLHWHDFSRMVRALFTAYPDAEPMELSLTQIFRMILQLPGFDDDPEAVDEDQLEKTQLAWHEVKSA